jgi:NADH:ubiquinone oxidoreductase subunit 6 (subunit J)
MTPTFVILAMLVIAAAVAAMSLRNLVHCVLAVVGAFGGLAALYLQLNAQFVGFTQILVYIGAVAILIVFAVLLTRGGAAPEKALFSSSWCWGAGVVVAVFGTLTWAIRNSFASQRELAPNADVTVKQIGDALMTQYVLPLEVVGLLLTAALIGAVIIAMRDEPGKEKVAAKEQPHVGGHS